MDDNKIELLGIVKEINEYLVKGFDDDLFNPFPIEINKIIIAKKLCDYEYNLTDSEKEYVLSKVKRHISNMSNDLNSPDTTA